MAPPSDQVTKCQRVLPFGASCPSLNPTVWLDPCSRRSRKTLKFAASNWMTAAVSLACATVSAPNRSRKDIVRRSEEHTSELQSRSDIVCRLLLEKKKKKLHSESM